MAEPQRRAKGPGAGAVSTLPAAEPGTEAASSGKAQALAEFTPRAPPGTP